MNKCSCNGCEQPYYAKGWCARHYKRWAAHGPDHWSLKVPGITKETDSLALAAPKFISKVIKDNGGCWLWNGSTRRPSSKYNYTSGEFRYLGKEVKAHRMSWMIHRGPIPAGAHVLHTCDEPLCVNPDHLYLGDHQDNMRDMAVRHRSGQAKLTVDQAREIKQSRELRSTLAKRYGVSIATVKDIRAGRRKYL